MGCLVVCECVFANINTSKTVKIDAVPNQAVKYEVALHCCIWAFVSVVRTLSLRAPE